MIISKENSSVNKKKNSQNCFLISQLVETLAHIPNILRYLVADGLVTYYCTCHIFPLSTTY